ncbi:MAG: putative membrane protein, partial [bacterium]
MLVKTRGNTFGIAAFHWRGSALRQIWPWVLLVGLTSLGVDFAYTTFELDEKFSLGLAPFSLIGLALSIFLGFRNNACYDRFWEARKHWGSLVNNSRTFARSVSLYVADHDGLRRELVLRQLAFVHALRMHLRGETDWQIQLEGLLPESEIAEFSLEPNVPNAITRRLGERLRDAWKNGHVDLFHLPAVEGCVATDTDVQGACERIKNTPLPASYTMLTHRIVGL